MGQPIKAHQIGRGPRVQNHHAVIVCKKTGPILGQGGGKRVLRRVDILQGILQGDGGNAEGGHSCRIIGLEP